MEQRLIDANELKKALNSNCVSLCNEKQTLWCEHCCPHNEFEDLIDNAPTIEQEIYITGEALNPYLDGYREGMKDYKQLVAKIEELEKEKRPRGKWIYNAYDAGCGNWHCSNCGTIDVMSRMTNFCFYCGADMRGIDNDNSKT